ncbi:MAG: phosphoribosyltransferase domain-containing protein [Desulfuromonadaceae bacterium]
MTVATTHKIELHSGCLDIRVDSSRMELDKLCGYASRQNRKRSFLFISKVLGKHWPARPSEMREVYRLLAADLADLPGPVLVIGMAETATGFGQGIYDSLLRLTGREDIVYINTTRYHSSRRTAFDFQEVHSHATDHLLYLPETAEGLKIFATAASLVIADDEISTGTTALNLLTAYLSANPTLLEARFVSITNWLGAERDKELREAVAPVSLDYSQILRGTFTFTATPGFSIDEEIDVRGTTEYKDLYFSANWGRFGVNSLPAPDFQSLLAGCELTSNDRILVLGSGEFSYPPFLLAEYLEERGYDVRFQTTTRSPIMIGNDVQSRLRFIDNYGDGIANFVYNVRQEDYTRIIICYENPELPEEHRLPAMLGAHVLHLIGGAP